MGGVLDMHTQNAKVYHMAIQLWSHTHTLESSPHAYSKSKSLSHGYTLESSPEATELRSKIVVV